MSDQRSDEELAVYLAQVFIGELESHVIEVVDHDPVWAFTHEATKIHAALAGHELRVA